MSSQSSQHDLHGSLYFALGVTQLALCSASKNRYLCFELRPATQAAKQQTQQHQQLAQHLHKEISKSNPQQRIYPQPPTPIQKPVTPIEPMTNGYDERDKDELVLHSRAQHPFKTISQIKSTLSGQKRGF